MVQKVKGLPAVWDNQVWSLGWEDPLEKEMANHSNSCLENPMDGGAWQELGYSSRNRRELGHVCSVATIMSDSLQTYELKPTRLLCPRASSGKGTGVGSCALHEGIFPTQRSNLHLLFLLHCRQILYCWDTREAQLTWYWALKLSPVLLWTLPRVTILYTV